MVISTGRTPSAATTGLTAVSLRRRSRSVGRADPPPHLTTPQHSAQPQSHETLSPFTSLQSCLLCLPGVAGVERRVVHPTKVHRCDTRTRSLQEFHFTFLWVIRQLFKMLVSTMICNRSRHKRHRVNSNTLHIVSMWRVTALHGAQSEIPRN